MKTSYKKYPMAILAVLLAPLCGTANALLVTWGGPVDSYIYLSDGVTPVDSSFTFQLGTFDSGFDFSITPFENWHSYWRVFDEAIYNDSTNYFSSSANLSSSGFSDGLNADTTYDFRSKNMFLWIYDINDPSQGTTFEWALMNGNWLLPTPLDPHQDPVMAFFIENVTNVEVGAVDPEFDGLNQIIGSVGTFTPPTGIYDLQTFTGAVPEVSSSLLFVFGISACILRRNRTKL